MPMRTANPNNRCAATAESTAARADANAAHTPSPVCLNHPPPTTTLDRRPQHLVMSGQRDPHRGSIRFPPTRGTLDVGEQERHRS